MNKSAKLSRVPIFDFKREMFDFLHTAIPVKNQSPLILIEDNLFPQNCTIENKRPFKNIPLAISVI